jgi:hypothetical protein
MLFLSWVCKNNLNNATIPPFIQKVIFSSKLGETKILGSNLFMCSFLDRLIFYFLMKDLGISLIKDHKHKTLISQSIKLCKIIGTWYIWDYNVIYTNKILTIKYYLWLSYSANSCTKIVKEQICSEHTRSKIRIVKYPRKNYLNWPWEITHYTELSNVWGITPHNLHLLFFFFL